MAVQWWQKLWQIYVHLQACPQSAHLSWSAVTKLQPASVPTDQAVAQWDRQMDRRMDRGMLSAPLGWGA